MAKVAKSLSLFLLFNDSKGWGEKTVQLIRIMSTSTRWIKYLSTSHVHFFFFQITIDAEGSGCRILRGIRLAGSTAVVMGCIVSQGLMF